MWDFLRRLFSGPSADPNARDNRRDEYEPSSYHSNPTVDRYFELLNIITTAKADHDYPRAIRAARDSFPLLAEVARDMRYGEDGEISIGSIPAIETGGAMMAVMGDRDAIAEMRAAVTAIPDLADWLPAVSGAEEDADLSEQILAAVAATPGLQQNKLKKVTGATDGRRVGLRARLRIRTAACAQHAAVPPAKGLALKSS
jgi:hypothetical protein